MLPYNRQLIDEEDIATVSAVLRSDWLTTGPKVGEFEREFARFVGVEEAVTFNSGTAALHAIMHVLGLGPGDEVIVPAITFVATANSVRYVGATPVFADVSKKTLCLDPDDVIRKLSSRTKAVIAVDYAGHPCDYLSLQQICRERGLVLIADACHALGGSYRGQPVGSLADFSCFSFHPVKPITTGEGGMVTTNSPEAAQKLKRFRNHGIDVDFRQREKLGTWNYDMVELGCNYRLSDMACALGLSQLSKLRGWIKRRQTLAALYQECLSDIPGVQLVEKDPDCEHSYHLFIVRIMKPPGNNSRDAIFQAMRAKGIGVNVLYRPVYHHTAYAEWKVKGTTTCPVSEQVATEVLALPIFVQLTEADLKRVVETLKVEL